MERERESERASEREGEREPHRQSASAGSRATARERGRGAGSKKQGGSAAPPAPQIDEDLLGPSSALPLRSTLLLTALCVCACACSACGRGLESYQHQLAAWFGLFERTADVLQLPSRLPRNQRGSPRLRLSLWNHSQLSAALKETFA